MKNLLYLLLLLPSFLAAQKPVSLSGIYPHLAFYNQEGECGIGAVIPWGDRLWVITYGPHKPLGSSDSLYEITADLGRIARAESIGGTPANRMIHKESQQLFIGPYAIDKKQDVRIIPYTKMRGRHTGNARHLTHPDEKIYYATMEEGFYEVNVKDLTTNVLYEDAHTDSGRIMEDRDMTNKTEYASLPGAHGKGLYSGQGVLIFSNNGERTPKALTDFDIESGALLEWNGQDWKVVRRDQFVEITGPGGIYGNSNPATDPIWATGWDHKSVLLGTRDNDKWSFYRLPKASHSYDGAHGWNTEWPRIRDIGTPEEPDYLMTMHGMFWQFPQHFTSKTAAGIRPRSAYLKVIGDFTRWNDQLIFGCDDSAQREFLNKRKIKGEIKGPERSNSNLWFTDFDTPDQLGPTTAEGAVWLEETVTATVPSEPFLFAGWHNRVCWLHNAGTNRATFTFETDEKGNDNWKQIKTVEVEAGTSKLVTFEVQEKGEWIRITTDVTTTATAHFYYGDIEERALKSATIFSGLATVNTRKATGGYLASLGEQKKVLGLAAMRFKRNKTKDVGYYELNEQLQLQAADNTEMQQLLKKELAIPKEVIQIEETSVLITDERGRRWRLPLGSKDFTSLTNKGALRLAREVATERDLFNCHGTFYELPAENADGFAKIRPISSHPYRIHDFASYRGLLVLSGIQPAKGKKNPHVIVSDDGKAAVWAGTIDDLWKLGKPTGKGGPWKNTAVQANQASDPYLIGFYDKRHLELSHQSTQSVVFTIEVEPVGHGPWMTYKTVTIKPNEIFNYTFPDAFQARWIRFKTNIATQATAFLRYE